MQAIPQRHETGVTPVPPSQSSEDYYASLVNVIAEAANDPARVRKLVYAVVRSNLDPVTVFRPSLSDATWQAKTLSELEQAFQIERAIRRLEESTVAPEAFPQVPPEWLARPAPVAPAAEPIWVAPDPPPPPEPAVTPAELLAALEKVAREFPKTVAAVAPPVQPERRVPAVESAPTADHRTRTQRLWSAWGALPVHVHAVIAALIAAGLITGFSGSLQRSHSAAASHETAHATANKVALATPTPGPAVSVARKAARITETVGHAPTEAENLASFAAPRSFSVYATNNGVLTQLDPLPVVVSPPRVTAPGEIDQPSRIVLNGDKLSFIVFDHDFISGAPQTVSARVVGRVSRLVRYIDGQIRVMPFVGAWRVRDKTYELRVSPVEGRDIVVIRPEAGVTLPAGRYALMLNGRGYDFTVAGPITAREQCLEQTEVVNGVVFDDCTTL